MKYKNSKNSVCKRRSLLARQVIIPSVLVPLFSIFTIAEFQTAPYPSKIIEIVFKNIWTLLENDYVRTTLVIIFLFILIQRTIKASLSKSPIGESANKIATALAAIAIIGIMYRLKDAVMKLSGPFIILGLVVLIIPIFKKIFNLFGAGLTNIKKIKNSTKKEKKDIVNEQERASTEKAEAQKAESITEIEKKINDAEKELKNEILSDEEKREKAIEYIQLLARQQLLMGGKV